jgi:PAS domain-containing protein
LTTEQDEEGEVTALIGMLEDITARKRLAAEKIRAGNEREMHLKRLAEVASKEKEEAEARELLQRQLEQKTNEFARMSKGSTCGLTSATDDGKIFWANDAFFAIHSLEPGSDPNLWGDIVDLRDLPRLVEAWEEALAHHSPLRSQHRLKNGKTVLAQSVRTIDRKDGSVVWVGSVTDITAQVESEAQVAKLSEERVQVSQRHAQEAEERRKVAVQQRENTECLVDMVSHETRNAISPILHSTSLVKKSLLELQRQLLEMEQTAELSDGVKASMDKLEDDFEALDAITDSAHAQERVSNDILVGFQAQRLGAKTRGPSDLPAVDLVQGLAQLQLNQMTVTPAPFDLRAAMKYVLAVPSKGPYLRSLSGWTSQIHQPHVHCTLPVRRRGVAC